MKIRHLILDAKIGPPRPISFRMITNWLTCRLTDRPLTGRFIRRSRVVARAQYVISGAACKRDFVAFPVSIPVVRNNRKSGLGTAKVFSNNPFFPAHAEKNAVGRIREALAICNTCSMLEECRNLTEDVPVVSPGFVQGGMVYVEKVTDMRKGIKKWNDTHPRALRIPTKGPGAWVLRRTPTPKQLEEYIVGLTTTRDFRAATLQIAIDDYEDTARELDELDPYETDKAWAAATAKHLG